MIVTSLFTDMAGSIPFLRTSLGIQWLRFPASKAEGTDSTPDKIIEIPQAVQPKNKNK